MGVVVGRDHTSSNLADYWGMWNCDTRTKYTWARVIGYLSSVVITGHSSSFWWLSQATTCCILMGYKNNLRHVQDLFPKCRLELIILFSFQLFCSFILIRSTYYSHLSTDYSQCNSYIIHSLRLPRLANTVPWNLAFSLWWGILVDR